MAKKRVYEFAKENEMSSKDVISNAKKLGIDYGSHMSSMEPDEVSKLQKQVSEPKGKKSDNIVDKVKEKVENVNTQYFYTSSDMSAGAFAEPSHWSTTNANGECGEPQPIRPCQITVSAGNTLNSVLSGKNNNAVLAISQGYKSNPE